MKHFLAQCEAWTEKEELSKKMKNVAAVLEDEDLREEYDMEPTVGMQK